MINALLIEKKYKQLMKMNSTQHYFQIEVEVVDETGSTNADLIKRANNIQKPVMLIAKHQTAGRGRAGRIWYSLPDSTLTMSLAWKLNKTAQELMGISLVIGVALAEKLIELGVTVQLKWPNDILKLGNKLGGILIESQKTNDHQTCLVIGVGINLKAPDLLENLVGQQIAESAWLENMDRNDLIVHLITALSKAIIEFEHEGFTVFKERWNALNAHAQKNVNLIDNGVVLNTGKVIGIDDQGCLLLQTNFGVQVVHAGDVSLRTTDK